MVYHLQSGLVTVLMKYLTTLIDFLFGCHHHGLSRVFSIAGRTYKVCYDCGAEFKYSLNTMSVVQRDFAKPSPTLRPAMGVQIVQQRVWRDAA